MYRSVPVVVFVVFLVVVVLRIYIPPAATVKRNNYIEGSGSAIIK